jgi:hypothetical protein
MAAITKVSLSFKETRQKTLAKLEGIALLSLLGAALKNKFFNFLTFSNANCWSSLAVVF